MALRHPLCFVEKSDPCGVAATGEGNSDTHWESARCAFGMPG